MRARGHEVLLICATDEHGTPAELAAAKAGEPVADYCARLWAIQKELGRGLPAVVGLVRPLVEPAEPPADPAFRRPARGRRADRRGGRAADLFAGRRALPARPLRRGHLPELRLPAGARRPVRELHQQLDPTDLIEPRSAVSGSTDLEVRETKHLYLLQSQLREELRRWIAAKTDWPLLSTSIALKWLDDGEGLQDRGITRDLDWGIPVQARRRAVAGHGGQGLLRLVRRADRVHRRHRRVGRMERARRGGLAALVADRRGRGRRHATCSSWARTTCRSTRCRFPATILGSGEPWKLVDYIKAFNWLNYYGGKFSTSEGRGVFMDQALELLPPDYWRWWLMANVPEGSDANFTWESFQAAGQQGPRRRARQLRQPRHQVRRGALRRRGARGRRLRPGGGGGGRRRSRAGSPPTRRIIEAMELRKAAQALRAIWVLGNEYLQAAAPWTAIKTDRDRAAAITRFSLNLIRLYAVISRPFLPDASDAMLAALGLEAAAWPDNLGAALAALPPGHRFEVPDVLFAKIDDAPRRRARRPSVRRRLTAHRGNGRGGCSRSRRGTTPSKRGTPVMGDKTLNDLFYDGLKDIYYTERKILKALPKMARGAQAEELKAAFKKHQEQTEGHVERLQQVFEIIGKRAQGKTCPAIDGIIEEGEEMLDEFKGQPALDAALVAAAQAVEHYEIARYGTLKAGRKPSAWRTR